MEKLCIWGTYQWLWSSEGRCSCTKYSNISLILESDRWFLKIPIENSIQICHFWTLCNQKEKTSYQTNTSCGPLKAQSLSFKNIFNSLILIRMHCEEPAVEVRKASAPSNSLLTPRSAIFTSPESALCIYIRLRKQSKYKLELLKFTQPMIWIYKGNLSRLLGLMSLWMIFW